jgi:hypothetical protein
MNARATVVLLGASNLTRGISTVVNYARRLLGSPLDFYVALGAGRSYGTRTRILVRELPGIRESAIWRALEQRNHDAPVFALITDIGNDILYGASVAEIVEWLRDALDRLKAMQATICIVQLPEHNVLNFTNLQFWLLNKILFPGRNLNKELIRANALLLIAEINKLAKEYDATLIEHDPDWYRFDPIHFKLSSWPRAWGRIMGGWTSCDLSAEAKAATAPRKSFLQWLYLYSRTPDIWWILGRERRRSQPCAVLADGSRFYLY